MEKIKLTEITGRISWGSIFGGVITVLAISILLSILSTSISFFIFDPLSDHPASGIGTNVGIWTIVSLLISLAAGGFVAGKLAGADGIIHGFLVWATSLIVTVIFMVTIAIGTVKFTTHILGSVSSVAGNVLSGVGNVVGKGALGLEHEAENLFGDMDFFGNVNTKEVRKDVRDALRKSGVREFQPEYLQNQLNAVKRDFNKSAKRLATHPNDADKIFNGFTDRLKTRTERFTQNIDRDDLTRAIANNTNLSRAEVDKAVDEYIELFNNAKAEGQEQIDNLEQTINQAKQEWEVMKQNARVEAEKASNAAGRSALISFFAILLGAVLCSFAGHYGTRKTKEGYEV